MDVETIREIVILGLHDLVDTFDEAYGLETTDLTDELKKDFIDLVGKTMEFIEKYLDEYNTPELAEGV